jgi:hypothetical protein
MGRGLSEQQQHLCAMEKRQRATAIRCKSDQLAHGMHTKRSRSSTEIESQHAGRFFCEQMDPPGT